MLLASFEALGGKRTSKGREGGTMLKKVTSDLLVTKLSIEVEVCCDK